MFEHMTVRRIILVRHGEATHHVEGRTGGWTDSELTGFGKAQAVETARALCEILRDEPVALFSSDLRRAGQTAQIVAEALGTQPILTEALREFNNGVARGLTRFEAERLLLAATEPIIDWIPYPEAESWGMMARRVSAFLESDVASAAAQTALIVSHGHAMVPIVHWWLGLGCDHYSSISFEFDCCSISDLAINQWQERVIRRLNDTGHLRNLQRASVLQQGAEADTDWPPR